MQIEPQDAIFPRHSAPVVRRAGDGERELVKMNWGFIRLERDRAPKPVTNVRDDKVLINPFWTRSFKERRCLVPVTAWSEPGQGMWHWFTLKGEEPRPLFAFAGIWRSWDGPVKKDKPPEQIDTFAFMMTPANAVAASIEHDRCPVILRSEDEFEQWMSGTPEQAYSLVRTPDPEIMHVVQSGKDKKDLLAA